jgi:hypothetical protein
MPLLATVAKRGGVLLPRLPRWHLVLGNRSTQLGQLVTVVKKTLRTQLIAH